ncbi:class I SAM-dependent methyltransferase [Acidihalobacter prosperus]
MPQRDIHHQKLPAPNPNAAALSQQLVSRIAEEIEEKKGWIGFDRYMERALYEPGFGYYSAGSLKFGAQGDFITAPALGELFARTLANQVAPVLGAIANAELLEFGAGDGSLAAILLNELARLGAMPQRYAILELSGDLRARQRETIAARAPDALSSVTWLTGWPENPIRGVVLANELFDAMPVRIFGWEEERIWEYGIGLSDNGLSWSRRAADADFDKMVQDSLPVAVSSYPDGYMSELNDRLFGWFNELEASMEQGMLLLIDYGDPRSERYRPSRTAGTLRAYYQHRLLHEPFWWPGLCDLTADVDFSAVARAAESAGLKISGFVPQSQMLLSGGLERVFPEAFDNAADEIARMQLSQEVKRLTLPDEMGERFWGMALTKDYAGPLPGFETRDFRYRLG